MIEIRVSVEDAQKLVRLQVDKSHTAGEVVEQIVDSLDLPRDRSYYLMLGKRVFGPDKYSLTIGDLGVDDGGRLKLISKIVEPTPAVLDEKVYGYVVDHGGVVSISKMSDRLGIPTRELDRSLKRLITAGRLKKTRDTVSVPGMQIITFGPEPKLEKRLPYAEERRVDRRRYLKYVGLTASTAVALASAYGWYEYTKPSETPWATPAPTPVSAPAPYFDDFTDFRVQEKSNYEIEVIVICTYVSDHGDYVYVGAQPLIQGKTMIELNIDGFSYRPNKVGKGRSLVRIDVGFDGSSIQETDGIRVSMYGSGGSVFLSRDFPYTKSWHRG